MFSVPEDAKTRLWYRFSTNTLEMITDKLKTIQAESLYDAQIVLLEVQNADGSWPRNNPLSGATSSRPGLTYGVTSIASQNNAGSSNTTGPGGSNPSQTGPFR